VSAIVEADLMPVADSLRVTAVVMLNLAAADPAAQAHSA
jgi:hypothetical protein